MKVLGDELSDKQELLDLYLKERWVKKTEIYKNSFLIPISKTQKSLNAFQIQGGIRWSQ